MLPNVVSTCYATGTIFGAFFLCSDAKCLVTRLSQVDKINYYSWFVLSPSLSKAQKPLMSVEYSAKQTLPLWVTVIYYNGYFSICKRFDTHRQNNTKFDKKLYVNNKCIIINLFE